MFFFPPLFVLADFCMPDVLLNEWVHGDYRSRDSAAQFAYLKDKGKHFCINYRPVFSDMPLLHFVWQNCGWKFFHTPFTFFHVSPYVKVWSHRCDPHADSLHLGLPSVEWSNKDGKMLSHTDYKPSVSWVFEPSRVFIVWSYRWWIVYTDYSYMYFLMLSKVKIFTEGFPTYITFIWFLSSVDSLMQSKVIASIEGFPTYTAFVRFLTGVSSLVSSKDRRVIESFPT